MEEISLSFSSITLSVYELVAALLLCDYGEVASELINQKRLFKSKRKLGRFIQQTETSLKKKGLMDLSRDTNLTREFESLIHQLVQAEKKVRSVNIQKHSVLIIHSLGGTEILIQQVRDKYHTFTYTNNIAFSQIFQKHYGLNPEEESPLFLKAIQISDEMYDELHKSRHEVLELMANDDKIDLAMQKFLKDFIKNEQQMDNISFMVSNYVEDTSNISEVNFLLPSNGFVWHLNYENVREHKISLEPIPIQDYFQKIEDATIAFFQEQDSTII